MFQNRIQVVLRRALLPVLASSIALPAGAQFIDMSGPQDILATDFIGMPVYTVDTDGAAGGTAVTPDMANRGDWDSIGEVNDLLLDGTGKIRAVLVDVGGFLGIGERTVAVDMTTLSLLSDETGSRFITVAATRPDLEAAPPFTAETMNRTGDGAGDMTAPRAGTLPATPDATTGVAPAAPMANGQAGMDAAYVPVPAETVTAEQLQNLAVYDGSGTSIGEIAEVLVQDGRVAEVLIDIGGFLGVGERRVLFPYQELKILQRPGDDDFRVEVDATRESLEKMPARES